MVGANRAAIDSEAVVADSSGPHDVGIASRYYYEGISIVGKNPTTNNNKQKKTRPK